jgi:hypothetical protein
MMWAHPWGLRKARLKTAQVLKTGHVKNTIYAERVAMLKITVQAAMVSCAAELKCLKACEWNSYQNCTHL